MLVDVSHHRHDLLLASGVHLRHLLHHRALDERCMGGHMCVVVLLNKRFQGLAGKHVLVLLHRVHGNGIVVDRHQLGCVLDPQDLDHLAVQKGQVIQLRCSLGKLKNCLVRDDLLRHRGCVGVRHGDHVHHIVVFSLGGATTIDWLVRILVWRVVGDDDLQELELLLHRCVDARLNRRHDLESPLQNGQCCAHGGLAGHVADLHVATGRKGSAFLHDLIEQRVQNL